MYTKSPFPFSLSLRRYAEGLHVTAAFIVTGECDHSALYTDVNSEVPGSDTLSIAVATSAISRGKAVAMCGNHPKGCTGYLTFT